MQQLIDNITTIGWAVPVLVGGFALLALIACAFLLLRRSGSSASDGAAGLEDTLAAAAAATARFRIRGKGIGLDEVSDSIESLTGYRPDALTQGDAFVRMIDARDADVFERRIVSAIQDDRPVVTDFRYEDADGRTRWMQFRGTPAREGRGRMTAMRALLRETTESRHLTNEMTAISARFHALADATSAMLWVLDGRGALTAVNRATERFCAVSEAALKGDGWLLAMPDEEQTAMRQFVSRVIDHGASLQREVTMIDPDNRERIIAMTATAAKDDDGAVTSVILTGRDITDRSEGEKQRERLTRLIESSESPALIIAPDMRVAMLNPVARQRAGLGERESADSIALWHVVTQETVERIRSEGVRVCADGGVYRCQGRVRDGADASIAAEFTVVGLGDNWLGLTAREVEHEIEREEAARLDRRRLDVMLGALDRLTGDAAAPGRTGDRMCEALAGAYTSLRAAYHTLNAEGQLVCLASDEPAWMGSARGRTLQLDASGTIAQALRRGEPQAIEDAFREPELESSALTLEEYATRSLAFLPVGRESPDGGVMTLERDEPGPWTTDELEALRLGAQLLGLALRAEREHAARMAAETKAAEQTMLWREERARTAELSRVAADRVAEHERLASRLARVDSAWSAVIVQLGSKLAASRELAGEAREAGLKPLAERLDELAADAERAEIAGRIVSGTLESLPESCAIKETLTRVGRRAAVAAKRRGVTLRLSQHGELPDSLTTDPRLFALACAELLRFGVDRCAGREIKAVASTDLAGSPPTLTMTIHAGTATLATEPDETPGLPSGLALVRRLAASLEGALEIRQERDGTTLVLRVPLLTADGRGSFPGIDAPGDGPIGNAA